MAGEGVATVDGRPALVGAVLLDLAVSPLFAWDVFTESLDRDLGAGHALLAAVFSVGLVSFMLGVLGGGRAADAHSPRRLALVALTGTVAGLLGTAAASTAPVLFLTFGVLVGGSTGLGYAIAVHVAGTANTRRGLAIGLVVSAYAAGTAVLAPCVSALLRALGRSWTLVVLACAIGVLLAVAAVLVPAERPSPDPPRRRPARGARPGAPVVALWLAFGLGSAPGLAAFAQAGELAGDLTAVTLAVVLLNVGNFAGRVTAGLLSDRVGRCAALHANGALLVIACVPLALHADGAVAMAALFLLGTQYGALSTLAPAATADVVPAARFGTTYGWVFTSWGMAGLLAPVTAATLAATIGYSGVYAGFLVVAALAWAAAAAHVRMAAAVPVRCPRQDSNLRPSD